ncbi:hypothetical protein VTP01DRAFT_2162 [Rhizomucor pusillus]|uniref:uncharacterized protein n=1 Tax=Rhizomucor pusillus TaxID=4840 RepID=UPI00374269C9
MADHSTQSQASSENETVQEQQSLDQTAPQSAAIAQCTQQDQLTTANASTSRTRPIPGKRKRKMNRHYETPEQIPDRVTQLVAEAPTEADRSNLIAERVKRRRRDKGKQPAATTTAATIADADASLESEDQVAIPENSSDDEDYQECSQESPVDPLKENERMAKYRVREERSRLSDDEEDYEKSEVIQNGDASGIIGEALVCNLKMQLAIMDKLAWINQQMENNERAMEQVQALAIKEEEARKQRAEKIRHYPVKFEPFVDQNGDKPVIGPAQWDDTVNDRYVGRRIGWKRKERQDLLDAVRKEARRTMVRDLVGTNQETRIFQLEEMPDEEFDNFPVERLDWNRISRYYIKSRTPNECMIQWTQQEHPSINKKPWSKKESEMLKQLVEKHGSHGRWEDIARELPTSRTVSQCFSHYQSLQNNKAVKQKWTKEDDEALRNAVRQIGDRNWQQIAAMLGNKTGQQCLQRWHKSINPAIRRCRWTQQEDAALMAAVQVYGVGNWNKVQRHIAGRTDMQCRERYTNALDPSLTRDPMTDEDFAKLERLVAEVGQKWSEIAKHFPGRTDNYMLRMWRRLQKHKQAGKEGYPLKYKHTVRRTDQQ